VSNFLSLTFQKLTSITGQLYSSSTAAPDAKNLDTPLKSRASLSLNYGNGGGEVLRFVVDEKQKIDLGFLRVYMSNKAFDLDIEQNALETILPGEGSRTVSAPIAGPKTLEMIDSWDAITLPVIQMNPMTLS
jgi:hypothetical protein